LKNKKASIKQLKFNQNPIFSEKKRQKNKNKAKYNAINTTKSITNVCLLKINMVISPKKLPKITQKLPCYYPELPNIT